MKYQIINNDCLNVLPTLGSDSIDLIATDPPYGIGFMGKDWDKFNEIVEPQGAYQHKKGFKKLPRNSSAFLSEFFTPIWRECLRVLKPGAFAFVMSIPRADCLSRMIISLEDAGFNVGFSPIYWTYASGFPKAQNISKAVDKRLGAEREGTGEYKTRHGGGIGKSDKIQQLNPDWKDTEITISSTPQAKALDGSYAGFQSKPAVEVIIVAMKPLSEKTYVDQALKNGKGISWLDDCRVPYESEDNIVAKNPHTHRENSREYTEIYGEYQESSYELPKGRFPANLLVEDDMLNDGRIMKYSVTNHETTGKSKFFGDDEHREWKTGYKDAGSFSRYFSLDKWWEERIKSLPASVQKTFPFLIVPKASKSEKNKGLEGVDPVQVNDGRNKLPDNAFQRGKTYCTNFHPTTKPIKLMSYLITLGSREGDVVLDPFVGSGSTPVAAVLLNRLAIGIELSPEYAEIARKRLEQTDMRLDL